MKTLGCQLPYMTNEHSEITKPLPIAQLSLSERRRIRGEEWWLILREKNNYISRSLKCNMKSLFSLFISHLRHNNTITDCILSQKAKWQNFILDIFYTSLDLFMYSTTVMQLRLLQTHFNHQNNSSTWIEVCSQTRYFNFQMFSIWAKISSKKCSRDTNCVIWRYL